MIRVGVVGLGKMGLSHLAMLNAHPGVDVVGIADTTSYLRGVLGKYTGVRAFATMDEMLESVELDAVFVCTPSVLHARQVAQAMDRGLHVFCEKPFCLDPEDSRALAAESLRRGLVNQVGYHNRYVGAFREVKRLLEAGAIGRVTHVLAEAYGPVVLKQKGATWRSNQSEGGGCLYDYAAHPIDLLSWYFGVPTGVGGTVLGKVFSRDTDDEVASTLYFADGPAAQVSVNWSDESERKMSTTITAWGTHGRINVDRQELQVYLREGHPLPEGYVPGWNVRYTTELTPPVLFYLRGEEYSAQIDAFVSSVAGNGTSGASTFESAAVTDAVIAAMIEDAARGPATAIGPGPVTPPDAHAQLRTRAGLLRLLRSR